MTPTKVGTTNGGCAFSLFVVPTLVGVRGGCLQAPALLDLAPPVIPPSQVPPAEAGGLNL